MRLTQRDVDGAVWSGSKIDIRRDDAVPGLALRVYPSGKLSYIIEWAKDRRRGREVIGDPRVVSLSRIREIAREKLASIRAGLVPAASDKTVEALCKEFIERHAKAKTQSWRQVDRLLKKWVIPNLGRYRVDRLTRGVVASLHSRIGKDSPINANRMLDHLRKIYNTAVEWGYIPKSFDNPATGVTRFPEVRRARYITPAEMPGFLKAIAAIPDLYSRSIIWLLLMTGCREREIMSLTWSQIDLVGNRLLLTRTKQKREHAVPLVPLAVEVIRQIPLVEDSPFLFPSTKSRSGHIESVRASWKESRKRAKLNDVTIHDLRRTVGSWMASAGTSLHVVGSILGHTQPSTTQIYARLFEDSRRKALEEAADSILGVEKP